MPRHILLVDDHELFRAGLHALLSTVYEDDVIEEADSAHAAMQHLDANPVDILILDYELPDRTGLQVLQESRSLYPLLKVFILTGSHSAPLIEQMLAAGADGVLAKRGRGDELIDAIDAAGSGPMVSHSFDGDLERAKELDQLTRREREALEYLARGQSTQQLADSMGVGFKTAETHKTRVMSKLEVHTATELITKARELGLLL